MPKKVLVLSYYWPPAGGPGVQRILKFCKFLPEFDWEPIIITPENGTFPSIDHTLEKDIPKNIKVIKTNTKNYFALYNRLMGKKKNEVSVAFINMKKKKSLFQRIALYIRANFFIPDARIGWNDYAYEAAKKVIKESEIDAILTSGPPHSTHLIGLKLKNEFNIPWVADFRDPWTNVYYNKQFPRTESTKRKDQKLENKVISNTDCLLAISPGLENEFKNRAKKIQVIYNGYDEEDIPSTSQKDSSFTLSYIGNFKANQLEVNIWDVISELCQENKDFNESLSIKFIGNTDQSILDACDKAGLTKHIKLSPYLPHKEATKKMVNSSILLFIVPKTEGNQLIVTGKLFEYLASKTPLLAIGPEDGNAADIINHVNREKVIDYSNKEAIKKSLLSYFTQWKNNELEQCPDDENLKHYSRRRQTKVLANILDELSN